MNEVVLFFLFVFTVLVLVFLVRKANLDAERRLTDMISKQLSEVRGSVDYTSREMNNQISSFTRETVRIKEEMESMQEAVKEISSFQEFFRSPKIRGQWGEAGLEHVLGEYFPAELYSTQHTFSSGEKVDAVLKLPSGKLLPIDSKFPFDNFRKMIDSQGKEKEMFRQRFFNDVKERIKEISEKYILPSESTVDFAVMYVPAEAVYYEINMERDTDISEYARKRKVILSSPNTFYLTLRAVEQWFRDTRISKHAQEIMNRLSQVEKDGEKLTEDFRKLGIHLSNASSAYKSSEKRVVLLGKKVNKILKEDKKITTPEKSPEEEV